MSYQEQSGQVQDLFLFHQDRTSQLCSPTKYLGRNTEAGTPETWSDNYLVVRCVEQRPQVSCSKDSDTESVRREWSEEMAGQRQGGSRRFRHCELGVLQNRRKSCLRLSVSLPPNMSHSQYFSCCCCNTSGYSAFYYLCPEVTSINTDKTVS